MVNSYEPMASAYNSRQRAVCVTLGLAGTFSVSASATLANAPMQPHMAHNPWPSHMTVPSGHTFSGNAAGWQTSVGGGHNGSFGVGHAAQGAAQSIFQQHHAINPAFIGAAAAAINGGSNSNDLNLASAKQNFLADNLANFHDITIMVGGSKELITSGTRLTAAEVVAAQQVLTGGTQTIKLNNYGTATGGTVVLNSNILTALDNSVGGSIGSLTISHGVKVIDTLSQLSITGNLNNYGSILTASTTAGSTDNISASSIFNAVGGAIGSYNGSVSGLFSADAILNALTSVTNYGTISSAHNLTINAPVVYNVAGQGGGGTISAGQNVNLNTQGLDNSGVIAALTGNINVASQAAIAVQNAGALEAKQGNINFNTNNADIILDGGDYVSKQLNIKAGQATAMLTANKATGLINVSGNNVHLYTDKSDLNLGEMDCSGDPTIASQLNINLSGAAATTNGNNLAIVSAQNVTITANTAIDTTQASGNGGSLIIVAGANFTGNGTTQNVVITDSANPGLGSITGGQIDLTGVKSLTTSGTGTGSAGSITMIAYKGSAANSGTIKIPNTVAVNAGAAQIDGAFGDVLMYAGATTGTAISTGFIQANNITLSTVTPSATGGVTIDTTGTLVSGAFAPAAGLNNSDIVVGSDISATGDVTITAGGAVSTFGISAVGIGAQPGQPSLDGTPGRIIDIEGGGLVQTGYLNASGGGGAGSGSATAGFDGGVGGDGGSVTVISTGNDVKVFGTINVSGGGGGGGAGGDETNAATLGGAGGAAGTVSLQASAGDVFVQDKIYAYNGGAGGDGGDKAFAGVGGGGGGGNAYGGAGGGGGGGFGDGTHANVFAAGGGGGFSPLSGAGGGGGGSADAGQGGQASLGGGGGWLFGGFGGFGDVNGSNGFFGPTTGGTGGGFGAATGGVGATTITTGGGGGKAISGVTGSVGGLPQVVALTGSLDITVGGKASGAQGSIATPIATEVAQLSVTGTTNASSANITNTSGIALDLNGAALGSAGSVTITTDKNANLTNSDGTINVNAPVTGGTITLTSKGAGTGNTDILIADSVGGGAGAATITSNGGTITTTGAGIIDSASATLSATGLINVATNVGTLKVSSTTGTVDVAQGTTPLNLGVSSTNNQAMTIIAGDQINTTGAITSSGGTITLEGGVGIKLGASINAGAGQVFLTSDTADILTTSAANVVTASVVNFSSANDTGSALLPISTKTPSIIATASGNDLYVSDATTTTLTVDAQAASFGTMSVASAAATLNIVEAPFSTVKISDSAAAGNVVLNSGNTNTVVLGDGTGTFTVTTKGNINANTNTSGIAGTTVSLTTTGGSIGNTKTIVVDGPVLVLSAAAGSVDVQALSGASVTGAAATTFKLSDTEAGGIGLTMAGPISATTINLSTSSSDINVNAALGSGTTTTLTINSGAGVTSTAAGTLKATTVSVTGVNDVTLAGTVTGNVVGITSTAGATTTGVVTGSGATPAITIKGGFNGANAVVINGAITGTTITLTGTGAKSGISIGANVGTLAGTTTATVTAGGSITSTGTGSIGATNVGISSSGGDIGTLVLPVLTNAKNLTVVSTTGNAFVSQTGNLSLGVSSASKIFNLQVAGTLSNSGTVKTTTGDLTLASTGAQTVSAAVTGGGGTTTLSAGGLLSIGAAVSAPTIALTTTGVGSNIVQTAGGTITASTALNVTVSGTATLGGAVALSTPSLSVVGSAVTSSADITDSSKVALTITKATVGATTGFLKVTTNGGAGADGTINVTGTVSGSAITLTTNGASGPNDIGISGAGVINGGTVALTSNGGKIFSSTASNIISGSSADLKATAGGINVQTNVSSMTLNATAASTIFQGATALDLGASTFSGVTVSLQASGQVNVKGAVTNTNGSTTITGTGVDIANTISGGTGSISLTGTNGVTDSTGSVITAKTINLTSGSGSIGSSTKSIMTNATTVNASSSSTGDIYVNDANAGAFTFNALSSSTGTLGLTSATSTLTLSNAAYSTVTVNGSGNVLFGTGAVIGDGKGVVTISTSGNIDGVDNTHQLLGTKVSLTSTGNSIGSTVAPVVTSASLVLNANKGSVNVLDTVAATSVTGSALNSFTLSDAATSGTGILVNSPISATTINLTTTGASDIVVTGALGSGSGTVNVTSGGQLTLQPAATVSATTIALKAATDVTAGGAITGNNITVTATNGKAVVSNNVNGTGAGSVFTIKGGATTGDAVTLGGTVTVDTITATSTSTGDITATGSLAGTAGAATLVTMNSGNDLNLSGSVNATTMNLTGTNNVSAGGKLTGTNIAVTATKGSASVTNTITATGAGNSVTIKGGLATGTAVTLGSTVIGTTITVDSTSAGGDVLIKGALGTVGSPSTTVAVTSKGNLLFNAGATVNSTAITLKAANDVTAGGTLTGTNITVTATGGVATISSGISASSGGSVNISGGATNPAAVVISGAVSGDTITITGSNAGSGVSLGAAVGTAATTSTTISAGGIISGSAAGIVSGTAVSLSSSNSDVGSSSQSILTKAGTTLSANAPAGSVYLKQTGNVSLTGSGAKDTFILASTAGTLDITGNLKTTTGPITLSAAGALTTTAQVTAGTTLAITATGASGAITDNNVLSGTSVTLNAATAITQGAAGNITSPVVSLTSTGATNLSGTIDGVATTITAAGLTTNAGGKITGADINTIVINVTGAANLGGDITAANAALTVTSTGATTQTGNIATKTASLTATTVNNSGALGGTTSLTVKASGSGVGAITNSGSMTGGVISVTDTSTTANSIVNSGSINGTTSVTLDNSAALSGGTITNTAAGTIAAPTITLNTATLDNQNSVAAGAILNIGNASGDLTITGKSGSFTSTKGAALTLSAKGNITAGVGANDPLSALTQLHSYTVVAGGKFTTPLGGLTVAEDGSGNGGTISITASDVAYNGVGTLPSAFTLNAPGTTGNGGIVVLNLSGTATSGITIGALTGQYSINAAGANGGTVNITTPGALTVNTANLVVNATNNSAAATGANITLTGTKSVLVKGNLDTHFLAGQFGDVTITTGSGLAFTIDGSIPGTINGQTGIIAGQGIFGKVVTINDAAGATVGSGDILSGSSAIIINGNTLNNNGTVNTSDLTIAANGTATLSAAVGTYSKLNSLTVSSKTGGINLVGGVGKLPQANTINLTALAGTINFGKVATSLTADVDGSGNGGTINISGKTLTSAALTLDAKATTGAGGTVNINLTGTTAIKFDSKTITVDVTNATGKAGGNVSVTDNANVTVDANFLKIGSNFLAGSGANLTLSGKTVHVSNAKSIDTNLHNLTFITSAASFTAEGATATGNGLSGGNTTLKADNLSITNNGGTIIKGTAVSVAANTLLTLKAKTDIGQTGTKSLVISAPTASVIGGGSVYLTDTSDTTFTNLQALTTLQLTATGKNVIAPATLNAKTLNLAAGTLTAFSTTATTITANIANGDVNIKGTGLATAVVNLNAITSGGDVTISSAGPLMAKSTITASKGGISLTSNGLLTTKAALTGAKDITLTATGTKGAISVGGSITTDKLKAITLTASGTGTTGTILNGSGTYQASAGTVNLTTNGANIGSTATAFRTGSVNPITINVTSGATGIATVTNKDTAAAGSVTLGTTNVGSLKFTATNSTTTNTGTVTVGTIKASTGAILITTTEKNLAVSASGNLSTVNGNITLQNTNISSNVPTINIGANSTIHASTPGTLKTAGNVFIALGTVPTSATVKPGVAPTGPNAPDTSKSTTANLITYGSTTNLNGSITNGTGTTFTSLSRNLSFNTGVATNTKAQIVVGNGVTIIADPPESAATGSHAMLAQTVASIAPAIATSAPAIAITSPLPVVASASNVTTPMITSTTSVAPISALTAFNATAAQTLSADTSNRLTGGISTTERLNGHDSPSGSFSGYAHERLNNGATLLAPEHNTVVDTQYGPVAVAAGAVVMLVQFNDGLAVYDLHDSRQGAVVVGSGPQSTRLVPGRSAVLTRKSVKEFEEINPAPFIGYRQVASQQVDSELKVFRAEFEIMSMIRNLKPLATMMASDKAATRKTMNSVLKTAAILWQLTGSQKPFRNYVAAQKMACLPSTNP